MKKTIAFLISILFTLSCSSLQPKQVEPNLADYLPPRHSWNAQDIWEHNIPGNELPEICPVECMCPNLFGLIENPCKKPCAPAPVVKWKTDIFSAAIEAGDSGKLLAVVFTEDNCQECDKMLERFETVCVRREVAKHYVPVLVTRMEYNLFRNSAKKKLSWEVGDYFTSPSLLIAEVIKSDRGYGIASLPISFEGTPTSVCRTLKGFYNATH